MKRTTIMADPEVVERLKRLAADRGVPFSEVVREALVEKAAEFRPKPRSLGIGQSSQDAGPIDWEKPAPAMPWR